MIISKNSNKDAKFIKQYPLMAKRIQELEQKAHFPCGLDGFDGYQPLLDRLDLLEKAAKKK